MGAKGAPLEGRHYREVFKIKGLPKVERPLVLFTGSGIGSILRDAKEHTVSTAHGKAKLIIGHIEGVPDVPVVVVPRHSDPEAGQIGHDLLPHQVNEPAYAVAVAALNPAAVVTMHTIGAAPVHKSIQPGRLTIIEDFVPTANPKTIFNKEVTTALKRRGYSLPLVAHTPLPSDKLKSPVLAKAVASSAAEVGLPLAKGVVCHTISGPAYETSAQIKFLVKTGFTGFSMTHANDVITLQEALRVAGSDAHVVSIATISNLAQGLGKPISHEEVEEQVRKTAPQRTKFLVRLARRIGKLR